LSDSGMCFVTKSCLWIYTLIVIYVRNCGCLPNLLISVLFSVTQPVCNIGNGQENNKNRNKCSKWKYSETFSSTYSSFKKPFCISTLQSHYMKLM